MVYGVRSRGAVESWPIDSGHLVKEKTKFSGRDALRISTNGNYQPPDQFILSAGAAERDTGHGICKVSNASKPPKDVGLSGCRTTAEANME